LASPKPNVLFGLPPGWETLNKSLFGDGDYNSVLYGKEQYVPAEIDYYVGFRSPHGLFKTLTRLKAVFSLGAGVDGFLRDAEFPRHLPLVRFVDPTLQREMAQYVLMHVLMIHRQQRAFDALQAQSVWHQHMLAKPSRELQIGILGMGDIGEVTAARLLMFDFQVSGWSRSRKQIAGVKNYAGKDELGAFLAHCDILVCMLPLTPQTEGILDAGLFAQLPRGAWVINVARGGHLSEADLVAALDCGQLGGAVLDVFRTEPLPPDSPLWKHPKITVTPHIAGITDPRNAAAFVADCVARAERGEPFVHQVDVAKGY
jgi:glyoxylate/hydroxypyruvate reductase A